MGVPEEVTSYIVTLRGRRGKFPTCFISFSEPDDQFSRKLYDDLRSAGVRCWRWREHARWGRDLWGEVDEAIREYDKLIVVLSEVP